MNKLNAFLDLHPHIETFEVLLPDINAVSYTHLTLPTSDLV